MTIIVIYILIYLSGVVVFGYLTYRNFKGFTKYEFLSWIGVVIYLYFKALDYIEEKLNK